MSLYQDGTQITIPSAWPVPGRVDPTLVKLNDVAVPGGPSIDLADYADASTEPQLEIPTRKLGKFPTGMKLGDAVHFDENNTLKHLIKPGIQNIPTSTLLSTRDWR